MIATDANPLAVGLYMQSLFDAAAVVPKATDQGYWEAIEQLVKTYRIDYAVILPELEVLEWSRCRDYGALPCKALIPDLAITTQLMDKALMTSLLSDYGLVPQSFTILDTDDLNGEDMPVPFPFWVRSASGSSGLGSLKAHSVPELKNWILINPGVRKFFAYTKKETGRTGLSLWLDIIKSNYRYNVSILEYFQFRFFEKDDAERQKWAGTGTMYEFQLIANPISQRKILDDKRLFYKNYREFIQHQVYTLDELIADNDLRNKIFEDNKKLVLKESRGKVGTGVKFIETATFNPENLITYMKSHDYGLLETYITQHSALNALSPSAVNTVRVITQIKEDNSYEVLGCRLRISVGRPVDNMGAGNIVAPIDEETGVVNGEAVYSDITKPPVKEHPITGVSIVGFQIPFWKEIMEMVKKASLLHPENKSIGWDVAVTPNGPELIEGNHDWCKLVWQMPVHKGLRARLNVLGYKDLK